VLPLSLSYDHRVVNGADAARFCRAVATALARPEGLLNDNASSAP
jgi:pyruvate dehydrogenase E2 component (dihydrolipoamide acetyltransferase)